MSILQVLGGLFSTARLPTFQLSCNKCNISIPVFLCSCAFLSHAAEVEVLCAGAVYSPVFSVLPPQARVPQTAACLPQEKKKNEVPQVGNSLFNVNKLLYDRIVENDYFYRLGGEWSYQELMDEIVKRVTHVEPWAAGTSRNASTAWCILVKLCQFRLTTKQLQSMLRKTGQPYVRAMGFLYLRLVVDPKSLWDWMEDFVDDPEMFAPSSNPDATMPMGDYVQKILKDMHYYDTVLPRIPVPIERKMKALMILFEDEQKRAKANLRAMHLLTPGATVQAIYKDEENDPAFYEATVVEVLPPEEDGRKPQVVVTFNEYGNTETVSLGKVMLSEGSNGGGGGDEQGERRRSRDRGDRERDKDRDRERDRRRSRSRDRDRSRDREPRHGGGGGASGSLLDSVMSKVTERDRDRSAATGKDYAQRPGKIVITRVQYFRT